MLWFVFFFFTLSAAPVWFAVSFLILTSTYYLFFLKKNEVSECHRSISFPGGTSLGGNPGIWALALHLGLLYRLRFTLIRGVFWAMHLPAPRCSGVPVCVLRDCENPIAMAGTYTTYSATIEPRTTTLQTGPSRVPSAPRSVSSPLHFRRRRLILRLRDWGFLSPRRRRAARWWVVPGRWGPSAAISAGAAALWPRGTAGGGAELAASGEGTRRVCGPDRGPVWALPPSRPRPRAGLREGLASTWVACGRWRDWGEWRAEGVGVRGDAGRPNRRPRKRPVPGSERTAR